MKKSLYLFIFCFFLLGYNCIGWGFGLSDITDAAKSTVNKAKDSVTSSKSDGGTKATKSDGAKGTTVNKANTSVASSKSEETKAAERNKKIAEEIASSLERIREKILAEDKAETKAAENNNMAYRDGIKPIEKVDVENSFRDSLKEFNNDEISKAITDNRQELDKLIAEQKQLKTKRDSAKLQKAWQHLIEIGSGEGARKEYKAACEKYLSQEQINAEEFRYFNTKNFDSRVKLYKDIYSGTSCAWLMISPLINSNPCIGTYDKFRVAGASGEDGKNKLFFLFSNGENLLPQGQDTKNLFQSGAFAAIVTFGEGITVEDVLKKNESSYGKFNKTTIKEYIILKPYTSYRLACENETWGFENDSIKVEIQHLVCRGGKAEEIAKSSPDYPSAYVQPDPGEIDAMVEKLNSRPQPVTMSVYDMKRVKKLNALYQEELNALNVKRQASEKAAQDKADQAKKDALNF